MTPSRSPDKPNLPLATQIQATYVPLIAAAAQEALAKQATDAALINALGGLRGHGFQAPRAPRTYALQGGAAASGGQQANTLLNPAEVSDLKTRGICVRAVKSTLFKTAPCAEGDRCRYSHAVPKELAEKYRA